MSAAVLVSVSVVVVVNVIMARASFNFFFLQQLETERVRCCLGKVSGTSDHESSASVSALAISLLLRLLVS